MDNGEAYDGLLAAVHVEQALGDTHWASVASAAAASMLNGIKGMWSSTAQDFNWAKFPGGGMQTTNWSVLYPDALEQASTSAFHVAEGHAAALMSTFAAQQPLIANPAADGYQPLATIGLEATGATSQGVAQARAVDAYASTNGYAWPFNVATAGQQVFADSDSALVGA
jgi:hypothetical protein